MLETVMNPISLEPSQSITPKSITHKSITHKSMAQRSNDWWITAQLYDLWRVRSLSLLTGQAFPLERELAGMLDWLRPVQGSLWLDVGTSTGNYARALSSVGAKVIALDASSAMLRVAGRRGTLNLCHFTLEAAPFPAQHFDGIVVGATLNEFEDTVLALGRMADLLKPGGQLFMMYLSEAPTVAGRMVQKGFALGGIRFPSRARLLSTLEQLGMHYLEGRQYRAVTLELYVRL
jgi:ubiquinone/menaquinone biosynthesis C-methylase UbiE